MSQSEAATVSVSTTETSPVLRTLTVEVQPSRVRAAFDRAYRDLARSVRVKGFRPGKAPRAVLEKLYGSSLVEEIEQRLVRETLPEAVSESGLQPVSEPAVETQPPTPDAVFRYTVAIEVKPEIELPLLEGLPAKRPKVEVTDEDVAAELESLRERRATLVEEPEGAQAGKGSLLTIDYAGRIDGELFEGGSAEGAPVELGSGRFIPGFEEQLQGAKVGEIREVRVSFPAEYPAADVAGKDAVFQVTVKALRRRELPALDDSLAQGLGEELADLAALRERIRSDLLAMRERHARQEARRTLMDALMNATAFDVPPGMIERRLAQRLQMAHDQLGRSMDHDELHQRMDQWREEWRPDAERDVREALLLDAVASNRGFAVDDAELDAKIEELARGQGIAPDRLRSAYQERGVGEALRAQLREEKALEFLLSEAKVEEISGT